HLRLARLRPGHGLQLIDTGARNVRCLYQQAASDALQVQRVGTSSERHLERPYVGPAPENLRSLGSNSRSDDDLYELLHDRLRACRVKYTVEGDDAPERRCRVGGIRLAIGLGWRCSHGRAAGIGMLDDHASRLIQTLDTLPGRIGVGNIVIGKLLPLELPVVAEAARGRLQVAIERSFLVRVFAVAQRLCQFKLQAEAPRERRTLSIPVERGKVVADRSIVGGGVGERLAGQLKASFPPDRTVGG